MNVKNSDARLVGKGWMKYQSKRCSLKDIQEGIRQKRLQWFGHVRREGEERVLRMVEKVQVTGNRLPGRPRGRLERLVQRDMKKKGLKEEQAMD